MENSDLFIDELAFKSYLIEVSSSSSLKVWKSLLRKVKYIEKNSKLPTVILSLPEELSKEKIQVLSGIITYMKLNSMIISIIVPSEVKDIHCDMLNKADSVISQLDKNELHINDILAGNAFMSGASFINSTPSDYLRNMSQFKDIYTLNKSSVMISELLYIHKDKSFMFAA